MEIIDQFKVFFENKGYLYQSDQQGIIAPLETGLLFVNAGIINMKKKLLSKEKAKYSSNQICIRISGKHNDISEIGSSIRHSTSFDMLGHFRVPINNEVDKYECIDDALNFLINVCSLNKSRLHLTIHPESTELKNVAIKTGLPFKEDFTNVWSAGEFGDKGYCIEIYYTFPNGYCMEIWNCVFVTHTVDKNNNISNLKKQYLDSGMGLSRLLAAINNDPDIYNVLPESKLLQEKWELFFNIHDKSLIRMIFDHIKTCTFILNENIDFSNNSHGYVLRKLFRRMIWIISRYNDSDENKISKILYDKRFQNIFIEFLLLYDLLSFKSKNISEKDNLVENLRIKINEEIKKCISLLNEFNKEIIPKIKTWDEESIAKIMSEKGVPQILLEELIRSKNSNFSWERCMNLLKK